MISTRDLSLLPDVEGLRRTLQSMATLDAILCPEWKFRYYSFNGAWDAGEQMGSMRNGSGDEFFAHFSRAGCWLKGFAHDCAMSPYRENPPRPWPGVLNAVPTEFAACLREPAFSVRDVTFCIWRRADERAWRVGPADYYERDVELAAVEHVYQHRPLTPKVLARLNPAASIGELAADVNEIGYPGAGRPA